MGKCEVEVFSRVTGFFRPVQQWNEGKQAEFKDRKKYNLKGANNVLLEEERKSKHKDGERPS